MRYLYLVAALALCGCGDPKPLGMAATPESSRAALGSAFDNWKSGITQKELGERPSAPFVIDDDYARGAKLLDYQIEGEGRPVGTGYSYLVAMTLQDGGKQPVKKKIAYRVVTDPKSTVSREDKQP